LLSSSALAAAYLRRLGYGESEAAKLVESRPLKGDDCKVLLSELVSRHVLRIPFENLEQHSVPSADAARSPTPLVARLDRLANVRHCVERLAFGIGGGVCFDLNSAFVWLLRELGASARIAMAAVHEGDSGFQAEASHIVVLVDLSGGPYLLDPGFGDPPRAAIALDRLCEDGLATYEVCDNSEQADSRFTKVLKRKRESNSMCRHIHDIDDSSLDAKEADWTPLYAFCPEDDLKYDDEKLKTGLELVLTPGKTLFTEKRFICLGLPKGYMVLSEKRLRSVEGTSVKEEVIEEGDSIAWQKLAEKVFSTPLLNPPPNVKVPQAASTKNGSTGYAENGNGVADLKRAFASKAQAIGNSAKFGNVDAKSLAVGGAGAGGGLGLNRPGFGPKVQHFAGGGGDRTSQAKSVDVSQDIHDAWLSVIDDSNPTSWIYCTYSSDGKSLQLAGQGQNGLAEFKQALGDAIAWGGFRCYGVDKRGGLVCKRPKFVFVQHKPESASAIKKAKQGSHKGEVRAAITGTHLDLTVETLDDLDEQTLITKMQAATGAHKPNGYEFDDGVFIEADFYGLGIGGECKGETSRN